MSARSVETPRSPRRRRDGRTVAATAAAVGLLYTAVSVYWGVGGVWLLDTVGGSFEQGGRAGNAEGMIAVWTAAAAKLLAALLPLLALGRSTRPTSKRTIWVLAWAEAAILTTYGLVLSVAGLLVQADVIHPSATADHRALAWHAYLWDPWFLLWGLLLGCALRRGRPRRSPPRG